MTLIDSESLLVQLKTLAWHLTNSKPLPKPMLTKMPYVSTKAQWIKSRAAQILLDLRVHWRLMYMLTHFYDKLSLEKQIFIDS